MAMSASDWRKVEEERRNREAKRSIEDHILDGGHVSVTKWKRVRVPSPGDICDTCGREKHGWMFFVNGDPNKGVKCQSCMDRFQSSAPEEGKDVESWVVYRHKS